MEGLSTPEHERQPKPVTGLFQLSSIGPLERSSDGKVIAAKPGPRFAVKDVPILHTEEGWKAFAAELIEHLDVTEKEAHEKSYSVAETPIDELTESMSSGQIRLVSPDEYAEAYRRKYGDAIYIPTFW